MKLALCSGCLGRATVSHEVHVQQFILEVEHELHLLRPNIPWKVSATQCQRFCPPQRITWVLQNKMGMSASLSAYEVALSITKSIP